jgi:hypothetical protein
LAIFLWYEPGTDSNFRKQVIVAVHGMLLLMVNPELDGPEKVVATKGNSCRVNNNKQFILLYKFGNCLSRILWFQMIKSEDNFETQCS